MLAVRNGHLPRVSLILVSTLILAMWPHCRVSIADSPADSWPEGTTVKGRVLDHQGAPVPNAEVLLLGDERVLVDAPKLNVIALGPAKTKPPSAKTNAKGEFSVERKQGTANRLLVLAPDPLYWEVMRKDLPAEAIVEIKLPQSGSLTIHCDLPGKPAKQPIEIDLLTLDDITWNGDKLRFHFGESRIANPGDTTFEHLPPARYSVECEQEIPTSNNSRLMDFSDRQMATVASGQTAQITIDRKKGKPLVGKVKGLEDVKLNYAHVTIRYPGPEEEPLSNGKRGQRYTVFEMLPIDSQGDFKTDPIPPGKYWAELYAVKAENVGSAATADYRGRTNFVVPETGDLPTVTITATPDTSKPSGPALNDRVLHVVDEQGKPLPEFELRVHSPSGGGAGWTRGAQGIGPLELVDLPPAFNIIVKAKGYASVIKHYAGADRDAVIAGKASLTIPRGEKVRLQLNLPEGVTWPNDALPDAYFEANADSVFLSRNLWNQRVDEQRGAKASRDANMLGVEGDAPGGFHFQLARDAAPFFVGIHIPGFLRYFDAGPFTFADVKQGALAIDVPKPATLRLVFDPATDDPAARPYKYWALQTMLHIPKRGYFPLLDEAGAINSTDVTFTDLPAGNYIATIRTGPDNVTLNRYVEQPEAARFSDRKTIDLQPGQSETVKFRYAPFDPQEFRGNRTAVVRIEKPDGTPAAGVDVTVSYRTANFGLLPVFQGKVPESGEIELANITDAKPAGEYTGDPYFVTAGNDRLGGFRFKTNEPIERFTFRCPPMAGDTAPDVELLNVADGKTIKLSDLRGKIVLLDFWATWCGPCQPALEKLDQVAAEKADAWKDRVVVLPVSIDDESAKAKEHLISRGWTHLTPYWTGAEGKTSFEAPAMQAFVVNGVPTSFLIDPQGKILWRGHPMSNEAGKTLEDRIEEAISPPTGTKDSPSKATEEKQSLLRPGEIMELMVKNYGYRLPADKDLVRIAPPFANIRMDYYRASNPAQAKSWESGPIAIVFRSQNGKLENGPHMTFSTTAHTKDGYGLEHLLGAIVGVENQQIDGPKELLEKRIPGDWVIRNGAKDTEIIKQLVSILESELGVSIKLEFREVEREVYVARGDYHFTALPNYTRKFKEPNADQIEIFGLQLVPDSGAGGGGGTLDELFNWVGNWISIPIVSEVKNQPTKELSWWQHARSPWTAQMHEEDHDPKLVLEHLTAQTGITFIKEKRPVRILFAEWLQ